MFEKNLKLAYLLDFYGEVLDEHTRSVMNSYYEDDLSLAEIAEGLGISRQGVRHIIKRGEEQLEFFEERLGLSKRHEELTRAAEEIKDVADRLPSSFEEAESIRRRLYGISAGLSDKNG